MSGIIMSSTATSNGSPASTSASASVGSSSAIGSMPHERACRVTISRFVALSSTTRMRLPASCGSPSSSGIGLGTSAAVTGSEMRKVEPLPCSLSTEIVPPISSTRRLEMARPSPVPPKRRVVDASTWLKEVKSRSIRSGGIPIPVSRTQSSSRYEPFPAASASTRTITSPASVNLTPFESRFSSTCRRRAPSPRIPAGTVSSMRQPSSIPFSHPRGATMSSAPSTQSRRRNGSRSRSSLPASIFE